MNIDENYFLKSKEKVELIEKIQSLEKEIQQLQNENRDLKIKLEEKNRNDIITQYNLLRQKKNFPFSSALSKNII